MYQLVLNLQLRESLTWCDLGAKRSLSGFPTRVFRPHCRRRQFPGSAGHDSSLCILGLFFPELAPFSGGRWLPSPNVNPLWSKPAGERADLRVQSLGLTAICLHTSNYSGGWCTFSCLMLTLCMDVRVGL